MLKALAKGILLAAGWMAIRTAVKADIADAVYRGVKKANAELDPSSIDRLREVLQEIGSPGVLDAPGTEVM